MPRYPRSEVVKKTLGLQEKVRYRAVVKGRAILSADRPPLLVILLAGYIMDSVRVNDFETPAGRIYCSTCSIDALHTITPGDLGGARRPPNPQAPILPFHSGGPLGRVTSRSSLRNALRRSLCDGEYLRDLHREFRSASLIGPPSLPGALRAPLPSLPTRQRPDPAPPGREG